MKRKSTPAIERDDTFWKALDQVLAELSKAGISEIDAVDWDARLRDCIKLLEAARGEPQAA
jgi:nicotinamide riboside kinase